MDVGRAVTPEGKRSRFNLDFETPAGELRSATLMRITFWHYDGITVGSKRCHAR